MASLLKLGEGLLVISPFFLKKGFFSFVYLCIYLWLCWVFVAVCGLSLAVVNGGYSPAVVCRLLIAVTSLIAEHRL